MSSWQRYSFPAPKNSVGSEGTEGYSRGANSSDMTADNTVHGPISTGNRRARTAIRKRLIMARTTWKCSGIAVQLVLNCPYVRRMAQPKEMVYWLCSIEVFVTYPVRPFGRITGKKKLLTISRDFTQSVQTSVWCRTFNYAIISSLSACFS